MPPTNANPGAGGARVHGISKSDAASPSRNQTPAQPNPAARSATIILNEATALGICVGTDGNELVMVAPLRVPYETRRALEIGLDKYRKEVIDLILLQAARPGAVS
jgi:hypothetical protein